MDFPILYADMGLQTAIYMIYLLWCVNPFNPEFTIVIFIYYKPRIAAAILDL